jgi:hypothetical protein
MRKMIIWSLTAVFLVVTIAVYGIFFYTPKAGAVSNFADLINGGSNQMYWTCDVIHCAPYSVLFGDSNDDYNAEDVQTIELDNSTNDINVPTKLMWRLYSQRTDTNGYSYEQAGNFFTTSDIFASGHSSCVTGTLCMEKIEVRIDKPGSNDSITGSNLTHFLNGANHKIAFTCNKTVTTFSLDSSKANYLYNNAKNSDYYCGQGYYNKTMKVKRDWVGIGEGKNDIKTNTITLERDSSCAKMGGANCISLGSFRSVLTLKLWRPTIWQLTPTITMNVADDSLIIPGNSMWYYHQVKNIGPEKVSLDKVDKACFAWSTSSPDCAGETDDRPTGNLSVNAEAQQSEAFTPNKDQAGGMECRRTYVKAKQWNSDTVAQSGSRCVKIADYNLVPTKPDITNVSNTYGRKTLFHNSTIPRFLPYDGDHAEWKYYVSETIGQMDVKDYPGNTEVGKVSHGSAGEDGGSAAWRKDDTISAGQQNHTDEPPYIGRNFNNNDLGKLFCDRSWAAKSGPRSWQGEITSAQQCAAVPYNYELTPMADTMPSGNTQIEPGEMAEFASFIQFDEGKKPDGEPKTMTNTVPGVTCNFEAYYTAPGDDVNNPARRYSIPTHFLVDPRYENPDGTYPALSSTVTLNPNQLEYRTNKEPKDCYKPVAISGQFTNRYEDPYDSSFKVTIGGHICVKTTVNNWSANDYIESIGGLSTEYTTSAPVCVIIAKKAQIQLHGSDSWSGVSDTSGEFDSAYVAKTDLNGGVSFSGSWSQYGLISTGNIGSDFGSSGWLPSQSSFKLNNRINSNTLKFSNTDINQLGRFTDRHVQTNMFSYYLERVGTATDDIRTIDDVFNLIGDNIHNSTNTLTGLFNPAEDIQWYNPTGINGLIIDGLTIPKGRTITIIVNGDVNITGEIKLADERFNNIFELPDFRLIATGSIYVDGYVRNLFGTYITLQEFQSCKQGPNRSNVTKESVAGTGIGPIDYYDSVIATTSDQGLVNILENWSCYSRNVAPINSSYTGRLEDIGLTVQGALIVNSVKFERTNGSESVIDPTPAELIKYTPNIYLSEYARKVQIQKDMKTLLYREIAPRY